MVYGLPPVVRMHRIRSVHANKQRAAQPISLHAASRAKEGQHSTELQAPNDQRRYHEDAAHELRHKVLSMLVSQCVLHRPGCNHALLLIYKHT